MTQTTKIVKDLGQLRLRMLFGGPVQ